MNFMRAMGYWIFAQGIIGETVSLLQHWPVPARAFTLVMLMVGAMILSVED